MKKIACIALVILLLIVCFEIAAGPSGPASAQASRQAASINKAAGARRFEKMSDHVYFLESKGDSANVTAVSAQEGFLLINPPAEPELQPVLEAVRRIGARPVRWVLDTDYLLERNGGGTTLLGQGAALLASKELRQLASPTPAKDAKETPADQPGKSPAAEESRADPGPRIFFTRQMRLFPDNLEIRIIAIQHKARTAGDIVVFVPAEKVLITGDLFESGSFPEVDSDAGGTALGWIDGLKQAIDTVPLLKSAVPPPKPDPRKPPPEEKTLEEQVTVIPGRGPRSNLQEMKDLMESALKLRSEMSKAVGAGRSRESLLNASALGAARSLANFESFANRLFDELSAQKAK